MARPRVDLASSTVLLTGATGGLGHAIARGLHEAGARLVLSGRRPELLAPLAAELGGARTIAADLTVPEEAERLAAACVDVDVVVANAGLPASGDLRSFTVEQLDRALAVNLRAPMVLARVIGEAMAARGRGHLVFMSSLSGKSGQRGSAVYSATKFALRGFGQGLRGDLRDEGVGVSVIFPGFVREAGMFVDAGAALPRGVGTSTPADVTDAVIRAIERDRGEIDVAPLPMRAGTVAASLAPDLSARVARLMGSDGVSAQMAAGQTDKR